MTRTTAVALLLLLLAACNDNASLPDPVKTLDDGQQMVKAMDKAAELRPMLEVYAETVALFEACRQGDVLAKYDEAFAKRSHKVAEILALGSAQRDAGRHTRCDDEKRERIAAITEVLEAP